MDQLTYREALERIVAAPESWLEAAAILDLAERVAGPSTGDPRRERRVGRIAARLGRVARQTLLLARAPQPAIPAALAERSVWDLMTAAAERDDAERATTGRDLASLLATPPSGIDAQRLAAEIESLWESFETATRPPEAWIRAGIGPVEAPADLAGPVALEIEPSADLSRSLSLLRPTDDAVGGDASPAVRAPGWVWTRIRADLRDHRRRIDAASRHGHRIRWTLLAASVLFAAVLWGSNEDLWRTSGGTSGMRDFEIVVIPMSEPIDAGWSAGGVLRRIRDGR